MAERQCYACRERAVVTYTLHRPGKAVLLDACKAHRSAVDGLMAQGRGPDSGKPARAATARPSRHAVVVVDAGGQ